MIRHPSQKALSRFQDGELPEHKRRELRKHLDRCERCQGILRDWKLVAQAVSEYPPPPSVPDLWPRLATALQKVPAARAPRRALRWAAVLTPAAAVLAGILLWRLGGLGDGSGGMHQLVPALDLALYAQEVGKEGTPTRFHELYEVKMVRPDEANRAMAFPARFPRELPGGYHLSGTYLLQSACCRLLQLQYEDGTSSVSLFQAPGGHPIYMGEHSMTPRLVGDRLCHTTMIEGLHIFQWDEAGMRFALVGDAPESALVSTVRFLSQAN